MSPRRRRRRPVLVYLLALLGLLLGGIWLWNATRTPPRPRPGPNMPPGPPAAGPPAAGPPAAPPLPGGEEFSATERQQLEEILRRESGSAP